jgi:ABC-type transport system involved in cytochrome c biogenesis ATPase subunit
VEVAVEVAVEDHAGLLVGRDDNLRVLVELLDQVGERGAALHLRGEPGIGKTALLDRLDVFARQRGFGLLRTRGSQAEIHLRFAGLHQLLRPALTKLDRLPFRHRAALGSAFGIAGGEAPDNRLLSVSPRSS